MNGFDQNFSAELGQGTGVCHSVLGVQRARIVLSSTVRSHEHRSFPRTPHPWTWDETDLAA
jgi:hypothetical protein